MRLQDPVWKDCFVEMTVKDGMFNMSAAVRLTSLLEMYALGLVIAFIIWRVKKWWKRRKTTPGTSA